VNSRDAVGVDEWLLRLSATKALGTLQALLETFRQVSRRLDGCAVQFEDAAFSQVIAFEVSP
jgi:hypothetical protein